MTERGTRLCHHARLIGRCPDCVREDKDSEITSLRAEVELLKQNWEALSYGDVCPFCGHKDESQ